MMCIDMIRQSLDFVAFEVDQLAAFRTLEMITVLTACMFPVGNELITGTAALIDRIFIDYSFGYKLLELAIYGRSTY